jgi:hypothetical protein
MKEFEENNPMSFLSAINVDSESFDIDSYDEKKRGKMSGHVKYYRGLSEDDKMVISDVLEGRMFEDTREEEIVVRFMEEHEKLHIILVDESGKFVCRDYRFLYGDDKRSVIILKRDGKGKYIRYKRGKYSSTHSVSVGMKADVYDFCVKNKGKSPKVPTLDILKRENEAITKPNQWMMPDNSQYVEWSKKTFRIWKGDVVIDNGFFSPKMHQLFVRDYLQTESPYRGLLLYHGLGSGKTCTSIAISEMFANFRKIVVIMPKMLKSNFISQLMFCGFKNYIPGQKWKFIRDRNVMRVASDMLGVKIEDGLWLPDKDKDGVDFKDMSNVEKRQLMKQIQYMIDHTYSFYNYPGIQRSHMKDWDKNNPFDNKVVIIDEMHNLMGAVSNSGEEEEEEDDKDKDISISRMLHNYLMKANNVKVILLSGTPIINKPIEIAHAMNLIKGHLNVYKVKAVKNIETKFQNDVRVMSLRREKNYIVFTLTPSGFVRANSKSGQLVSTDEYRSNHNNVKLQDDIAKDVVRDLMKDTDIDIKRELVFPIDDFNSTYIENGAMKNKQKFMKNIFGCVSYYEISGDNFPTKKVHTIEVDMSKLQFDAYSLLRDKEIRREKGNIRGGKKQSLYKSFTRLVQLFFVENRPWRSILNLKDVALKDRKNVLEAEIMKVQNNLMENGEKIFVEKLNEYSPKMASLLGRLNNSDGLSLVYTQYRMLEGVWAISQVLKFNGWSELTVKRDKRSYGIQIDGVDFEKITDMSIFDRPRFIVFTDDAKANEVLLKLFRGESVGLDVKIITQVKKFKTVVAKTLIITKSGAEGISLINVRQVHILEPYWNMNRIDQVAGRAIRMGSHNGLPLNERHVDIYIYVSNMTASQLKSNPTLKGNDKGLSTDKIIWKRAMEKVELNSPFLECMKRASIDCNYHNFQGISCYVQQTGEINIDIENKQIHGMRVTIQGVDYIWVMLTKKLYDFNLYVKTRKLKHVGNLEKKSDDIFFMEQF